MRVVLGAMCAALLAGCEAEAEPRFCGVDVVVGAPANSDVIVAVVDVRKTRIRGLEGVVKSTSQKGDTITLTVARCSENTVLLEKLLAAPGRLRIGVAEKVWLTEADIAEITMARDVITDAPTIEFRLTPDATLRFAQYTANAVGQTMEVTWDGRVLSRPVLQSPISGGQGQIVLKTADESLLMAIALRSGPMPIRIVTVKSRTLAVDND